DEARAPAVKNAAPTGGPAGNTRIHAIGSRKRTGPSARGRTATDHRRGAIAKSSALRGRRTARKLAVARRIAAQAEADGATSRMAIGRGATNRRPAVRHRGTAARRIAARAEADGAASRMAIGRGATSPQRPVRAAIGPGATNRRAAGPAIDPGAINRRLADPAVIDPGATSLRAAGRHRRTAAKRAAARRITARAEAGRATSRQGAHLEAIARCSTGRSRTRRPAPGARRPTERPKTTRRASGGAKTP